MTPSEDQKLKNAMHQSNPNMMQRIASLQKANQRMTDSSKSAKEESRRSDHTSDFSAAVPPKKVSFLRSLERNILALFKLGRIERLAKDAIARLPILANQIIDLRKDLVDQRMDLIDQVAVVDERIHKNFIDQEAVVDDKIHKLDDFIGKRLTEVLTKTSVQKELSSARHAEASRAFSDLSRRIDLLGFRNLVDSSEGASVQIDVLDDVDRSEGFKAFLDFFYHKLENRYRGSRSEIKNRLRGYLPEATAAIRQTGGLIALDLGCGRGEWLELLRDEGLRAKGIDLNTLQIEEAVNLGLDVKKGDALQVLRCADENSVSVITAHHVVEHLPFNQTAWIVRESIRVLAPGGVLIIETPNVRNLLVGANTFYDDPTHLKPITDSILKVLFETAGFYPIEARPLHPHSKLSEFLAKDKFDPELAYLLFGAQDIAVIGYKPKGD